MVIIWTRLGTDGGSTHQAAGVNQAHPKSHGDVRGVLFTDYSGVVLLILKSDQIRICAIVMDICVN